MILALIADAAAGISPEAVGTILGVALGSSGTWWMVKGRKAPQQSDDPQRFLMEDKYATREEVAELKALQAKTTDDMHKRLNGITVKLFESLRPTPELSFAVREYGCEAGITIKLNDMSGTLTLMIDILKTRKSL